MNAPFELPIHAESNSSTKEICLVDRSSNNLGIQCTFANEDSVEYIINACNMFERTYNALEGLVDASRQAVERFGKPDSSGQKIIPGEEGNKMHLALQSATVACHLYYKSRLKRNLD